MGKVNMAILDLKVTVAFQESEQGPKGIIQIQSSQPLLQKTLAFFPDESVTGKVIQGDGTPAMNYSRTVAGLVDLVRGIFHEASEHLEGHVRELAQDQDKTKTWSH